MTEPLLRICTADNSRTDDIKRENTEPEFYGREPVSCWSDPHITAHDCKVLGALAFFGCKTHPVVMATNQEVAAKAGVSKNTLSSALVRLERRGWITRSTSPRRWNQPRQITLEWELQGYRLQSEPACPVNSLPQVYKTNVPSVGDTPPQRTGIPHPNGRGDPTPSVGVTTIKIKKSSKEVNTKRGGARRPRTPREPNFFERLDQKTAESVAYYKSPEAQAMVDELMREMEGGDPCPR